MRVGRSKKQTTNRRFFFAIIITANFLPLVIKSPSSAQEALSQTKRAMLDPGGTGDIANALVIGAQMGFTF